MTPENSLFDPPEPEKKRRRGSTLRLQAQNDNLMQMLAAPENLLAAWHAVRGNIPQVRRARSSGPDGVSLADFERELPAQLSALRHALLRGTYRAQPPVVAGMPKKNGGVRKIAVLNVSDRVAQRAAQQVLEPIFEPGFLPCSYGFRPGLSTRNALEQANQIRAAGNGWVVDGDIESCFDSLDHALLLKRIELKVRDTAVLALVQQWVSVGILENCPPRARRPSLAENTGQIATQVKRSIAKVTQPGDWADEERDDAGWQAREARSSERYGYESAEPDDYADWDWDGRQGEDFARGSALRGLIASGAALGAGWLRPALLRLGSGLARELQSAAGRELLRRGALAGGGFVGAAVGIGAAAYVLYRRVAPVGQGVLQGSPLSPLLANIYLHAFDVSMSRAALTLVRFADDWVVFGPTQMAAERAYNQAYVALSRIHLKLNAEKTRIYSPAEEVNWLGGAISVCRPERPRRRRLMEE